MASRYHSGIFGIIERSRTEYSEMTARYKVFKMARHISLSHSDGRVTTIKINHFGETSSIDYFGNATIMNCM